MKIAWLSSWPPRHCGIATYSEELIEALRKAHNDLHIICHPDGGRKGEKNVYPVLNTEFHGWDEEVYNTIQNIKPDVVHVQHEYGLYQTSDDYASGLFRLLFRLHVQQKYPVIITYHSVYAQLSLKNRLSMDVMQRLIQAGIVHAEYQWVNLHTNLGRIVDNMYVIPHGAQTNTSISCKVAKKKLGLEEKSIIGMLGWFTPTKGFDVVLSLWDRIARELSEETVLLIAGDARLGDPNQLEYKKKLISLVEENKYKNRIHLKLGSFTPEQYNEIMASFDLMVMPYTFASQSGNLAHAFSLGVPSIVSGIEGLKAEAEASGAAMTIPLGDKEELKRCILTLMKDESLRLKYKKRAVSYVKKKISWTITAKKHLKVYKKAIARQKQGTGDLISKAIL